MSCGCNLQTGGRRKKRSRHSRRKFRGGSLMSGGEGDSPSIFDRIISGIQSVAVTGKDAASTVMDKVDETKNEAEETFNTFRNNEDVRKGIETTTNAATRFRDEIKAVGVGAIEGAQDAYGAVMQTSGDLYQNITSIPGRVSSVIGNNQSAESDKVTQSGGRRYRHKHKSRKMHRGGKSKKRSKRRTRKH